MIKNSEIKKIFNNKSVLITGGTGSFGSTMLDKIKNPISHIRDFNTKDLMERQIQISQHCYGCTAGAGSSCQGTVV